MCVVIVTESFPPDVNGVAHMLELLAAEMRVAMSLTGTTRIEQINRTILVKEMGQ